MITTANEQIHDRDVMIEQLKAEREQLRRRLEQVLQAEVINIQRRCRDGFYSVTALNWQQSSSTRWN